MNVAEKVSVTRPLVQVVDDDEALRNAAAWMLGGAGYEVRTYAAAAELLDALDTGKSNQTRTFDTQRFRDPSSSSSFVRSSFTSRTRRSLAAPPSLLIGIWGRGIN